MSDEDNPSGILIIVIVTAIIAGLVSYGFFRAQLSTYTVDNEQLTKSLQEADKKYNELNSTYIGIVQSYNESLKVLEANNTLVVTDLQGKLANLTDLVESYVHTVGGQNGIWISNTTYAHTSTNATGNITALWTTDYNFTVHNIYGNANVTFELTDAKFNITNTYTFTVAGSTDTQLRIKQLDGEIKTDFSLRIKEVVRG